MDLIDQQPLYLMKEKQVDSIEQQDLIGCVDQQLDSIGHWVDSISSIWIRSGIR